MLSKTLDPKDKAYKNHIQSAADYFDGKFQHKHRAWEYGVALTACRKAKDILDVGGGGSILAPALGMLGKNVHQVDPEDVGSIIVTQEADLYELDFDPAFDNGRGPMGNLTFDRSDFLSWVGGQYDAVTCISVLEHVPDDVAFMKKLESHVKDGGVLVVTVDFSPSGLPLSPWHLRTYNESRILELVSQTSMEWAGPYDYTKFEKYVYDWSFASIVLKKKNFGPAS